MDLLDLNQIARHEHEQRAPIQICCCVAAECVSADSQQVVDRMEQVVRDAGMSDKVQVVGVGCMRLCSQGPLVRVDPDGAIYQKVTPEVAPTIVAGLQGGMVDAEPCNADSPFFKLQASVVLENSGRVEPERIESYIAAGGYQALYRALYELEPAEIIDVITRSGLRGRGGAGYPTGVKWATVAKNPGERKFVVCNADEGDPGAFMNRSVLESDPHRVLEGMAIAGRVSIHGFQGRRVQRLDVHHPGRPRRLHRLRLVRGGLPHQRQEQSPAQSDQHDAAGGSAPEGADQLRLLPEPARSSARAGAPYRRPRLAIPSSVV